VLLHYFKKAFMKVNVLDQLVDASKELQLNYKRFDNFLGVQLNVWQSQQYAKYPFVVRRSDGVVAAK